MISSIAGLTYARTDTHFNAASIGLPSKEALAAVENVRRPLNWNGIVADVQEQFALLLRRPPAATAVFFNTTAAVQRILLCLRRAVTGVCPTMLVTDIEYPGILAAAHELWPGNIVVVRVARQIWAGDSQGANRSICDAFKLIKPAVLFVSHVDCATGWQIPDGLLAWCRTLWPPVVIVIDGAQAAGNILIADEVLNVADFYVTSGHKWLCGRTPLGLVHAAIEWDLEDPAQSYSTQVGSAGTGSLEVLTSVAKAIRDFNGVQARHREHAGALTRMQEIAEHNRNLATELSEQLISAIAGLEVIGHGVPSWVRNGILTVADYEHRLDPSRIGENVGVQITPLSNELYVQRGKVSGAGDRFAYLGGDGPGDIRLFDIYSERTYTPPTVSAWRISVHYYHGSDDIARVVRMFEEARVNGPSSK